jgi:hypothetical protein
MTASRSFWRETGRDPKTGKSIGRWVKEPDHRTRLEASKLFAAYTEALPVQRQMQVNAQFTDFQAVIEKVKNSPVMRAALGYVIETDSSQNGQNVLPEIPAPEKSD